MPNNQVKCFLDVKTFSDKEIREKLPSGLTADLSYKNKTLFITLQPSGDLIEVPADMIIVNGQPIRSK
jgi:hypothetical protein